MTRPPRRTYRRGISMIFGQQHRTDAGRLSRTGPVLYGVTSDALVPDLGATPPLAGQACGNQLSADPGSLRVRVDGERPELAEGTPRIRDKRPGHPACSRQLTTDHRAATENWPASPRPWRDEP